MAREEATTAVPEYNIYGHQHDRRPFVDKLSKIQRLTVRPPSVPPSKPPFLCRSRAELEQQRKVQRVPDKTYDFDGDGAIGQRDWFVGRAFDESGEGRLTSAQRDRANAALDKGWLDGHSFGYDREGCKPLFPTQQRRGIIQTSQRQGELSKVYPLHHNAGINPAHHTYTNLMHERRAELKNLANEQFRHWDKENPPMVPEPALPPAGIDSAPVAHIRARGEADHRAARVAAGLLPDGRGSNPSRDEQTVGLDYVEEPCLQTRTQLLEARKEQIKTDLDAAHRQGEVEWTPAEVRDNVREVACHDFRRGSQTSANKWTLTQLKDRRRVDRIEHDQRHFAERPLEHPRWSDQQEPWWVAQGQRAGTAPADALRALPRATSEPTLKITQWDPPQASLPPPPSSAPSRPDAAPAGLLSEDGSTVFGRSRRTVPRWTEDLFNHGHLRDRPRIFDCPHEAHSYARDFQHLDTFSSMEPVRNTALARLKKQRKRGEAYGHRSLLYAGETLHGSTDRGPGFPLSVSTGSTLQVDGSANSAKLLHCTGALEVTFRPEPACRVDPTVPERMRQQDTNCPSAPAVRTGGFQRVDQVQNAGMGLQPLGGLSAKNLTRRDARPLSQGTT